MGLAKALYDYRSNDSGHLNFTAGSIISIITKDSSGWWYGAQNGSFGWIPSNFIEELAGSDIIEKLDDQVICDAVDELMDSMESNDRNLIMNQARNLLDLLKRLPHGQNTGKIERRLSMAVRNPDKATGEWVQKLEEIVYMFLDMIENIDRRSTANTSDWGYRSSLAHPVTPQTPQTPQAPQAPEAFADGLVFNSLGKVKYGTSRALLEYLVDPRKSDGVFQTIFLSTYSLHFTSKEVLKHLRHTFYSRRHCQSTSKLILEITKAWINFFLVLKHENDSVVFYLRKFIDNGIRSFSPDDANECLQLLHRSIEVQNIRSETSRDGDKYIKRLESLNLVEYEATEISEILHNIYVKLFTRIEYTDWLLEKILGSESVSQMVNFSKHVSKWVKGILSENEDFAKKAFKVHKLIQVSRMLFKLQNFQGVKDILVELRSESITKYSLCLDSTEKDTFNTLVNTITQSDDNYSTYHKKLENLEGTYVPLLIAHCASLAAINNQVSNFSSRGLLNFSKMALLSFTMEKLLISQRRFLTSEIK